MGENNFNATSAITNPANIVNSQSKAASGAPVFKRLSLAERKERTAKCLCFNC